MHPGVAPGIFRGEADSSDEGLKYGLQGTINTINLSTGASMPRRGRL